MLRLVSMVALVTTTGARQWHDMTLHVQTVVMTGLLVMQSVVVCSINQY